MQRILCRTDDDAVASIPPRLPTSPLAGRCKPDCGHQRHYRRGQWGALFIGLLVTRWRTSLLPAIGMRPVISHDGRRGMGCVHQGVIILRPDAITDLFDLCRDRQHGIAKPVNFRQQTIRWPKPYYGWFKMPQRHSAASFAGFPPRWALPCHFPECSNAEFFYLRVSGGLLLGWILHSPC